MSENKPEPKSLLDSELVVVNIGLSSFADDLRAQGIATLHVEWSPPAAGDPELLALLDALL